MRRKRFAAVGYTAVRAIMAVALLMFLVPASDAGAIEPGHQAFQRTWERTDQPVASEVASRTWMWGPSAFTGPMNEAMTDAAGGGRIVQYFDKSRMEITVDPSVEPDSIWYVTNGLLARELVTGELQLGLDTFEERQPAEINVAGDSTDPDAPTYATFAGLLGAAPLEAGATITQQVDQSGAVTNDEALAVFAATADYYVPETGHMVASPFWSFMNSPGPVHDNGETSSGALFPNPFYATGLPISEAYWVEVDVSGEPTEVLVQVFERRVLTFTPDNPEGWKVEAGNVGRHYYRWRYGTSAPTDPPASNGTGDALGATPLPAWPVDHGDRASFTIANDAPEPLTVQIAGPESVTVEVPPCPDCEQRSAPPTSCSPAAPRSTVMVQPGSYTVTSARQQSGSPDLTGVWTFVPNGSYGACFYVIED